MSIEMDITAGELVSPGVGQKAQGHVVEQLIAVASEANVFRSAFQRRTLYHRGLALDKLIHSGEQLPPRQRERAIRQIQQTKDVIARLDGEMAPMLKRNSKATLIEAAENLASLYEARKHALSRAERADKDMSIKAILGEIALHDGKRTYKPAGSVHMQGYTQTTGVFNKE